jgi:hypothetical protein
VQRSRFANQRLTTRRLDFLRCPYEVLEGVLGGGEGMHGLLDGHGANCLQPTVKLDPLVSGVRRQLMDEQEPMYGVLDSCHDTSVSYDYISDTKCINRL